MQDVLFRLALRWSLRPQASQPTVPAARKQWPALRQGLGFAEDSWLGLHHSAVSDVEWASRSRL